MNHWSEVFRYELRQQFRRKAYLFLTFAVPVLALVALFGYQAFQNLTEDDEGDAPPPPIEQQTKQGVSTVIGYVDQTPDGLFPAPESYDAAPEDCTISSAERSSGVTATMIKRISSPYCLRDNVVAYDTREAGEAALEDEDIDALYIFEPDYVETGEIALYTPSFSLNIGSDASSLIEQFVISSLMYSVDPEDYQTLYLRLRFPATISEHQINPVETNGGNEDTNWALAYAFGLFLMLSLFWGGGYLMQSVVQEKESRIIEIILSSVAPVPLLLGKILAMGLTSLLQVALLLGTAVFVMSRAEAVFGILGGFSIDAGTLAVAAIYFVLGFLMFGSLMAAIGAMTNSVRESQNLVSIVTLPAAVPFFFLQTFVTDPNGVLAKALSIFPITAPLSMVIRASVISVPTGELLLSIALLALTVVGAVWLSGRLFRVNTLLMGKTPRVRDIPKLVRG